MEENKDNSKITRKRFLNVCGSLVAAGGIIGVSGTLVHKMVSLPEQSGSKLSPTWKREEGRTDSPYRRVAAFRAEGEILGFALLGDSLVVATPAGWISTTAWATRRAVLPSMGRFATSRFMPT